MLRMARDSFPRDGVHLLLGMLAAACVASWVFAGYNTRLVS